MQLAPDWIYGSSALDVVSFLLVSLLMLGIFVGSGLVVTGPLLIWKRISRENFVVVSVLASCLVSYLLYWVFFLSPWLGKACCLIIYAAVLCGVGLLVAKGRLRTILRPVVVVFAVELLLAFLVSMFYTSVLFSCQRNGQTAAEPQFCSITDTTFDNVLPLDFAQAEYQGIHNPVVGDWKSGDRPPLQSSIYLLQEPVAKYIGNNEANYQIGAVFLQSLWVVGVCEFIRRFYAKKRQAMLACILLLGVTNSFIYINSVFVWPKLLAANLCLLGAVVIYEVMRSRRLSNEQALLISGALSLSMLSHASAVFTVVPLLGLAAWNTRTYVGWRGVGLLGAAAGVLLVPWVAYQTLYNPPNDRLTKWWMGGVVAPDARPAAQLIMDEYRKLTPQEVLSKKLTNASTVLGAKDAVPYKGPLNLLSVQAWQTSYLVPSLGFGLAGGVLFAVDFIRSRRQLLREHRYALASLAVGVAACIIWVVSIFGPPNAPTIAFTGSYATFLLLWLPLAIFLAIRRRVGMIIALISAVFFVYTMGLVDSGRVYISNSYVCIAVLCGLLFAAIIYLLWSGKLVLQTGRDE